MTLKDGDNTVGPIVCGVDGSDGARVAVRIAAGLAREVGTRLVSAARSLVGS